MDSSKLVKLAIAAAVVVLAFPFVLRLLPKPVTFERAQAGFAAAGLPVADFQVALRASNEAVAEAGMTVNGVTVNIYQYDNEGTISRYMEYQKKDPGTAIVETWNLAQSLGAAVRKERPSRAVRRGMMMMVATGDDQAMVNRIADVFADL